MPFLPIFSLHSLISSGYTRSSSSTGTHSLNTARSSTGFESWWFLTFVSPGRTCVEFLSRSHSRGSEATAALTSFAYAEVSNVAWSVAGRLRRREGALVGRRMRGGRRVKGE